MMPAEIILAAWLPEETPVKILKALVPPLLLLGLTLAIGGCAPAGKAPGVAKEPQTPWPAPPNPPGLDFLGVFAAEKNFGRDEGADGESAGQPPGQGKLENPIGAWTLADDKIAVLERTPADIKVVDFSQRKITPLFQGGHDLGEVVDFAFDARQNLYVADRTTGLVTVYDKQLKMVRQIGAGLELTAIEKVALNEPANVLYLSDSFANEIFAFAFDGTLLLRFGAGTLMEPHGMAIARNGELYVADTGNARIRIFSPKGEFLRDLTTPDHQEIPLRAPWDLAFDRQGNLHVIDQGLDAFITFTVDGEILFATGTSKWKDNHLLGFNGPTDLHIDGNDRLLVTDANNQRLSVWQLLLNFDETGTPLYRRSKMTFAYDEYLPKEKSGKPAARVTTYKVGEAPSVALERVPLAGGGADGSAEKDAFKDVFCLGTVRCKACRSYNNIYVDSDQVGQFLEHANALGDQIKNAEHSYGGEVRVACRSCGGELSAALSYKEPKIKVCLEPRRICD
jgi:hypothetical protein